MNLLSSNHLFFLFFNFKPTPPHEFSNESIKQSLTGCDSNHHYKEKIQKSSAVYNEIHTT